jgi:hypothetical protein
MAAPAALQKVKEDDLRAFIQLCITPKASERPCAAELLKHPLLQKAEKSCMGRKELSGDLFDGSSRRGSSASLMEDAAAAAVRFKDPVEIPKSLIEIPIDISRRLLYCRWRRRSSAVCRGAARGPRRTRTPSRPLVGHSAGRGPCKELRQRYLD